MIGDPNPVHVRLLERTPRERIRQHEQRQPVESGRLRDQQRRLMQWLHLNLGEYTRSELAKRTGIRLSSICGRVSELIALGYLEEAGRRRCTETGRSAHPVRISLPKQPQQLDLLGATA